MNTRKIFPTICPSCGGELHVHTLYCTGCNTTISGDYRVPAVLRLKTEEQQFVTEFIMCSGSLKEMAARLSLSYPTVRNMLDEIIEKINKLNENQYETYAESH